MTKFIFSSSDEYVEPTEEEKEEILQQQFNDYYGYSGNPIYDNIRISKLIRQEF